AMMAHLMAEGVRTPVTVIPPGFDWPALHNEAMRPLPLHIHAWAASADNVPLIVQVGMLRPEKGHEFMLRVLYQLKMEGKSFRWLVVGAGREEYEARLRQQTEHLGMSGDVLMAGA
ncbi:glycosyltransferase, partial [Escherichia coli]|nr:glycosyltransferase [Escherichia coli]